jgi:hypothetical protein
MAIVTLSFVDVRFIAYNKYIDVNPTLHIGIPCALMKLME